MTAVTNRFGWAWSTFTVRWVLGLIFLMAGWWKCFTSLLKNGQRLTFGMQLKYGVMTATVSGKAMATTEPSESFLKKLAPGRVGIAWNGQWVKGAITEITIKGTLDKEWIEKQ